MVIARISGELLAPLVASVTLILTGVIWLFIAAREARGKSPASKASIEITTPGGEKQRLELTDVDDAKRLIAAVLESERRSREAPVPDEDGPQSDSDPNPPPDESVHDLRSESRVETDERPVAQDPDDGTWRT